MPKSARSSHRRKKVVHRRLPAAVFTSPAAAPSSASTVASSPAGTEGGQAPPSVPQPRSTLRDYSYVKQDLLRIAVIAAFLLLVLAVVTLLAG